MVYKPTYNWGAPPCMIIYYSYSVPLFLLFFFFVCQILQPSVQQLNRCSLGRLLQRDAGVTGGTQWRVAARGWNPQQLSVPLWIHIRCYIMAYCMPYIHQHPKFGCWCWWCWWFDHIWSRPTVLIRLLFLHTCGFCGFLAVQLFWRP